MREKVRCGAPKERGREGVCNRLAATPFCPEHMFYADKDMMFKVKFKNKDEVLVVRARRLGDVCDFIKPEVEIEAIL